MIYLDEDEKLKELKELKITLDQDFETEVRLKAIGVGGCGCNSINRMIQKEVRGVEFLAINTDFKDLQKCLSPKKIHLIGDELKGLGTGGNPEIARRAALNAADKIKKELEGVKMVFLTCGLGGGTGSGATGTIASFCKEMEILTLGFVIMPFEWEGEERLKRAEEGLKEIKEHVDSLIVIPNDKLGKLVDENTLSLEAFDMADDILIHAVQGVSEIVNKTGYKNIDFADIKAALKGKGKAIIGMGTEEGEDAAMKAAQKAISSPLLEETSISGATNVLFSFTGHPNNAKFKDFESMGRKIAEMVTDKNNKRPKEINFGIYFDPSLPEKAVRVIIFATGFEQPKEDYFTKRQEQKSIYFQKINEEKEKKSQILFPPSENVNIMEMLGENKEDKNTAAYWRIKKD